MTIWIHFQQFEDLNFLFISGGACPRTSLKPLQSVQLAVPNYAGLSRFFLRIPNFDSTQSAHSKYPNFEDQLSHANDQRNIYILNYHNICHKMNKPFDLDIQVNSSCSHVEWRKKYKMKSQTMLAWSIERLSNFSAFFKLSILLLIRRPV